jgi:hypothetical protein
MTVNVEDIFRQAEPLDEDEAAELTAARKTTAVPAKLVEGFDEQDSERLFVPASALGERRIKTDNGTESAPHNIKSLQTLAGNVRKHARLNDYEVNAEARKREGVLGILFTRETPPYREGVGRPKAEPAE